MSSFNLKFKKLLFKYDKEARSQILYSLTSYILRKANDPITSSLHLLVQELYQVNSWSTDEALKEHYLWSMMANYNNCNLLQEIVNSKLDVI